MYLIDTYDSEDEDEDEASNDQITERTLEDDFQFIALNTTFSEKEILDWHM